MSITFKCDDGDLMMATNRRFVLVTRAEKVAQDIAEALLNVWDPAGLNNFNGSELALIQGDVSGIGDIVVEERIRYAVQSAIERLMELQEDDLFITDDEKIEEIRELYVRRMGVFTYGFFLKCILSSGEKIPLAFLISLSQQLPGSLDLVALKNEIMGSDENKTFL